LYLPLSIFAGYGFFPYQLTIKAIFLDGELKEDIVIYLTESYKDGNKVAYLTRCINRLKELPREWYLYLTVSVKRLCFDTSDFDPYVLLHKVIDIILLSISTI
jgi:hypothetical protein